MPSRNASSHSSARVANPPSRWAVTTCGQSFSVTVQAPNAPCKATSANKPAGSALGTPFRVPVGGTKRHHDHAEDERPQGGGEVAMHHLDPRLIRLHRRIRKLRFGGLHLGLGVRHAQMAVATGPIRAAQARIGKARVGTQHDDHHGQAHGGHRQPAHQFGGGPFSQLGSPSAFSSSPQPPHRRSFRWRSAAPRSPPDRRCIPLRPAVVHRRCETVRPLRIPIRRWGR